MLCKISFECAYWDIPVAWKILQLTMYLQFSLIHCFINVFNHGMHCHLNTSREKGFFAKFSSLLNGKEKERMVLSNQRLVTLCLAMFSSVLQPPFEWEGDGLYKDFLYFRNRNRRGYRVGKMTLAGCAGHTWFACLFNSLMINSNYSNECFDCGMCQRKWEENQKGIIC